MRTAVSAGFNWYEPRRASRRAASALTPGSFESAASIFAASKKGAALPFSALTFSNCVTPPSVLLWR